jgi:hypothetical protein
MSMFSRATLQAHVSRSSPFVRGSIYFFLSLVLMIVAAEIVARSALGDQLPAPSVQADSFLLDAKIYRLEQQVRRDGQLDCVFIGSSVTNSDIDPRTVERVYHERTGETIHCFNLGEPAMTAANAKAFADAVVARYSPRLVIYTFIPRDVIQAKNNLDFVQGTPWFEVPPSRVESWLIQNSYAYRYFQTWRYLLLAPNRVKRRAEVQNLTASGYQPNYDIREPYPETINLSTDLVTGIWKTDYSARVLQSLISAAKPSTHILLIEGPIYRDAGAVEVWTAYDTNYLPGMELFAQQNHVLYLRSNAISSTIPKQDWYDQLHFNDGGAQAFSAWLGRMLAEQRALFQ